MGNRLDINVHMVRRLFIEIPRVNDVVEIFYMDFLTDFELKKPKHL